MIPDEAARAAEGAYRETLTELRLTEGGGFKVASQNRRALRAALEAAAPYMSAPAESSADELAAEYRRGYRDGLADRKQVTAEPREWEPGDPIE